MLTEEQLKFMAADDSQPIYQDMARELLESRWTPISESNLPTVADEVLHVNGTKEAAIKADTTSEPTINVAAPRSHQQ
jgi:hypothetical protein